MGKISKISFKYHVIETISEGHKGDVLSLAYTKGGVGFSGGSDGALLEWNVDAGYMKMNFSDLDKTAMAKEHDQGKGVEKVTPFFL